MSEGGKYQRRLLITGGTGFIGANLIQHLVDCYPDYLLVNLDALTYAANPASLKNVAGKDNYRFIKADIRDRSRLIETAGIFDFDGVIHLAAETHVDQSIVDPEKFVATNIVGTFNLLEMSRQIAAKKPAFRFHQVSTDEVFGALTNAHLFSEKSPYRPNSPYAASKAAADHLVRSYQRTYGIDCITTNCCNNFGPYQFPEKLIPLVIRNACNDQPIPVYGDGGNIRDWLYVTDHCRAIDMAFHNGVSGETYNVGGRTELANIDIVRRVCRLLDKLLGGQPREQLITFVKDRPGHDFRYAIDPAKIEKELGWRPRLSFDEALETTVKWYLAHRDWLESCISGEYLKYYDRQYSQE